MSFVDLLFPQAELEALGNKWHEPAPKRRKLGHGVEQVVKEGLEAQRRYSSDVSGQRRHRLSAPTPQQYGKQQRSIEPSNTRVTKRLNSDSQSLGSSMASTAVQGKHTAASKSCLPSFIEPSILKNYLRHLHPKDSHRYKTPNSPNEGPHIMEEAVSSPGSLVADSTGSPVSTDSCPTPAAVCEQFRSGPFGHLFDGMRLTENERYLMEDLLSPNTPQLQGEAPGQKRKQADLIVELAPKDYFEIDQSLPKRTFPTFEDKASHGLGVDQSACNDIEKDSDVHSSGLSPAPENEEQEENFTIHRGIVIYDYDALSVDDFFDLDEAST